ncbi:hypothetical protein KI387_023959 [Taxus chinensis]|uniref:Uncharacterized protein n=1 Tax=Taxus chinensis TaxID=29808 RepID=A0AA38G347_TAXCH|nr:hypothetical protein KI387_023959 [Taxus chinensis]
MGRTQFPRIHDNSQPAGLFMTIDSKEPKDEELDLGKSHKDMLSTCEQESHIVCRGRELLILGEINLKVRKELSMGCDEAHHCDYTSDRRSNNAHYENNERKHLRFASSKHCEQLLKELKAPVEHIILSTFAYEHKVFVGPFSRKFPQANIWVAPRQWSWPINLPLEFFGIFRAKTLKDEDKSTPWFDEIEQKILSSPELGIGPYVEVAFYHKRSRTLLVTDAVIYVPKHPPETISREALLGAAKNGLAVKLLSKGKFVPNEPIVDSRDARQKGWERMVLQILFLAPSNLLEPQKTFTQMSQKLIVSPIIKTLVFSKVPEKVKDWVDRIVADWPFKKIIPAHFAAPVSASRSDFKTAFAFLDDLVSEKSSVGVYLSALLGRAASYFPPDDMKTLSSLDNFLVSIGAVKKTVSGRKR